MSGSRLVRTNAGWRKAHDADIGEVANLRSALAAANTESANMWSIIELQGVTRSRARGSLTTAVDVLITRWRKAHDADIGEIANLRTRAERAEDSVNSLRQELSAVVTELATARRAIEWALGARGEFVAEHCGLVLDDSTGMYGPICDADPSRVCECVAHSTAPDAWPECPETVELES